MWEYKFVVCHDLISQGTDYVMVGNRNIKLCLDVVRSLYCVRDVFWVRVSKRPKRGYEHVRIARHARCSYTGVLMLDDEVYGLYASTYQELCAMFGSEFYIKVVR